MSEKAFYVKRDAALQCIDRHLASTQKAKEQVFFIVELYLWIYLIIIKMARNIIYKLLINMRTE